MQRLSGIIRKILFTLLFLILPTLAVAQDGLHITGIDLPEEELLQLKQLLDKALNRMEAQP